jgi:hypothetical protein
LLAGFVHKAPERKERAMKIISAVLLFCIAMPTMALAGPCEDDLAKIDKALTTAQITPEQRSQIEDMRNQAVQLCGAGNEQEGIDVLADAKAMLELD